MLYMANSVQVTPDIAMELQGHWLYVRKSRRPDIVDSSGNVIIALPDQTHRFADQPFAWMQILGKGVHVGNEASGAYWAMRKAKGYPKRIVDTFEVGEQILVPNTPWKMFHSPYHPRGLTPPTDFFIDETVGVIAYGLDKQYRVLCDNVLVETLDKSDLGGIATTDWEKHKVQTREAIVVAIGTGRLDTKGRRIPCDVSVGDKVLLPARGDTDVNLNGKAYKVLRESELLAILEKAA